MVLEARLNFSEKESIQCFYLLSVHRGRYFQRPQLLEESLDHSLARVQVLQSNPLVVQMCLVRRL